MRCEVIVELQYRADAGLVVRWFEDRGLDVLPLVVGLLVAGEEPAVREAFHADPDGRLPVPRELRDHVRSTARVSPKRLQS